jgi:UDPglucose--hexose-1-phosphate uridylyltransferase
MPELRLNLVSREWVVIGSSHARKPEEFRTRGNEKRHLPEYEKTCPFCVGNESKTPEELMRVPHDGPWSVRVTPNKFPIVDEVGERMRINQGIKRMVTGVGRHEVIVEDPRHNTTLALLSTEEVAQVLYVYRERFKSSFTDKRVQHTIIFRNHGPLSGTSISHPHSQLIATPVMPLQVRFRVDESMRYFDNTGECLLCATLKDEFEDGRRIVVETEHYAAFIPYAALSPFHSWIFPKQHVPSFGKTEDDELKDLAEILRQMLLKLYTGLNDPSYNLVVRSLSPFRSRSEYIHWYLSIVPQVSRASGFELGTGMHVNQAVPEEVAEFLREVRVS